MDGRKKLLHDAVSNWMAMNRAVVLLIGYACLPVMVHGEESIDFNRQIRPLLSSRCVACHGPDEDERMAGLRLDTAEGATDDLGGYAAVVPGEPDESELFLRITSDDDDQAMPPAGKGERFTPDEISLVRKWIEQGARYQTHWSYEKPTKAPLPEVQNGSWPLNEIDRFLLARLEAESLQPAPDAERRTLARRVALDLTGLPPNQQELDAFLADAGPHAYAQFVDAMLSKPAFGEHWARQWLDQARYADSSGYPSDQPREIWGYRDWVIGAFNRNLSFDRFTVEQLAGDLLPNPTEDQLIATAFHRNTMTQNEGGTSDEEFRIAAVVDRVNTTMEVWMGTTMACAQCHTHKFDPITQQEYFQLFAIFNQSADADRQDEAPVIEFFHPAQKQRLAEIESELQRLEMRFSQPEPGDLVGLGDWEQSLPLAASWTTPKPVSASSVNQTELTVAEDGRVAAGKSPSGTDVFAVELPVETGAIAALRLEALTADQLPNQGPGHANGNFVVTRVGAEFVPDDAKPVNARKLRITSRNSESTPLALAEVQVFSGDKNISSQGQATQVSKLAEGTGAELAIDGNSSKPKSVSVTAGGAEPQWWEISFDSDQSIDRIVIWKRADEGEGKELKDLQLSLLDQGGETVWMTEHRKTFDKREEITVSGRREIRFASAFADATQDGFEPQDVLSERSAPDKGWALAGYTGKDRTLTLLAQPPVTADRPGRLIVTIDQQSQWSGHTLGSFRIGHSHAENLDQLAKLPPEVLSALHTDAETRTAEESQRIEDHYLRQIASGLKAERQRLAALQKERKGIQPAAVPVMREVAENERRVTQIQRRGNWLDLGDEVQPALPSAFHPAAADRPVDRLALAQWLVSNENPLTARVAVNRFWEAIFGVGIVQTSEDFGSQGEPPFHPELLDWLAVDFAENGWDIKRLLRQIVTSHTYRQDSRSTPALNERDPDNRLLARGPRFRPTGEQLRDQALFVSGLLSKTIGGPAVRPLAPNLGLTTAFGRSNDWTISEGEDRHRRSVYTEVRRNSPYASFAAFDAPNRETCTIRRNRSNTPLQALVTLNDPVFVEANQALARRLVSELPDGGVEERISRAYRICLSREPDPDELRTLVTLFNESLAALIDDPDAASKLATDPLGPAPPGADVGELAAWTVIANVTMNLDEYLMRP